MSAFLLTYLEKRKFCLEEGIGVLVYLFAIFKESWDPRNTFTQQCQDLLSDTVCTATTASGSLELVRTSATIWGMVEIEKCENDLVGNNRKNTNYVSTGCH